MKRFLELVESARTKGIAKLAAAERGLPVFAVNYVSKVFWEYVEKAEILVFSPKGSAPFDLPEDMTQAETSDSAKTELDAPFPIFCVEMAGDTPICSPRPDDEQPTYVWAILVQECAPKEFHFWTLVSSKGHSDSPKFILPTNSEGPILRELLGRLNTESMGLETSRTNIKIGTGKEKRQHRIRRVIHICPKRQKETYSLQTRTIDWTHRFMVRGHWRSLNDKSKVGKNRAGEYCVTGFTWVSEHERGPEELPLVKKTRVVL